MKEISPLLKSALDNLKISKLNPMQLSALEASETRQDVVLLAPTGSGKTLGFLLPILENIQYGIHGIQALILAPSRELSLQIEQVFRSMGTGNKVNCCYGGHPVQTERNNLKDPPALLIGTPGRIADHLQRGRIDTGTIKTLVLDEFDKSLEFGFKDEMSYIINQLHNLESRILTSATRMDEIPDFTGISKQVELNFLGDIVPQGLKLKAVLSEKTDKFESLFRLLCKIGNRSTLVFCNHREAVNRVSELLWEQEVANDVFHGGMDQEDRERALIKFRNGSHHLLITTDLASRGLDIPDIEFIIHYQLPVTENAFVHRNGRTARMHAEGTTYLVLSENEKIPAWLDELPEFEELPKKIVLPEKTNWTTLYLGAGKKDKINKIDIVGLLLQKGQLKKDELGLITVLDYMAFAAVKSDRINEVVRLLRDETIKKKKVRIEISE